MPDPVTFTSTSARYELPFLFSGQSQKEFTVNEALALTDSLLHPAIEGTAETPPTAPVDGDCWLVGATPTDAWAYNAGEIACRQAGAWLFVVPRDGLHVLDKSTGQTILFRDGSWQRPSAPAAAAGGATVDAEARTAIADLIDALIAAGILPSA